MKRWPLKFDGANAGFVYADSAQAARRNARSTYKRVHPDRDPKGRVRVAAEGEEVDSEPGEAHTLISQVYEGLRLLPGMELPAEKLRSALRLLDTAVARDRADGLGTVGESGDAALSEALEPVLTSKAVPAPLKSRLRGLVESVGLNAPPEERLKVELQAFQALWDAGLVDFRFESTPACKLYRAGAYLGERLSQARVLRVERFEAARDLDAFRSAVAGYGKDLALLAWAFRPAGESRQVEVLRPLVILGDRVLQRVFAARGVPVDDERAVAFDRSLFDTLDRLRLWTDGLGRLAEPHMSDKQRQIQSRTEKRVNGSRKQMAEAAKRGEPVLPVETQRRDLIKFLIDQVHRLGDAVAMAFHPEPGMREAFSELVFKDTVFRSAGPYLSDEFGIQIDTGVVAGADSQALVGRFKKEPGGPRPQEKSTRIHSVVIPCYSQEGVAIRPASVRLGVY